MPRITISYRRDDSLDITGRIFELLARHYGRESVFRDIDNIPPGVDFRKHINSVLDESDIVLAIVGPKWIGPRANQSRLANAADPVRVEIETALRKDRPVIPVLVQRARMPRVEQLPESMQDFAYRNAVDVDSGRDFEHHMSGLIRAMDGLLEGATERPPRVAAAPDHRLPSDRGAVNTVPAAGEAPSGQRILPVPDVTALLAEIEELRRANEDLEAQLTVRRADDHLPQPDSAALLSEIEALRDANQKLEDQVAAVELSHTEAKQQENELSTLRETKRALETQVSGLATALREETEKATKLRDEVAAALFHREQEAKNLTEKLNAALRSVAAATSERDDLERRLEEANRGTPEQAGSREPSGWYLWLVPILLGGVALIVLLFSR